MQTLFSAHGFYCLVVAGVVILIFLFFPRSTRRRVAIALASEDFRYVGDDVSGIWASKTLWITREGDDYNVQLRDPQRGLVLPEGIRITKRDALHSAVLNVVMS